MISPASIQSVKKNCFPPIKPQLPRLQKKQDVLRPWPLGWSLPQRSHCACCLLGCQILDISLKPCARVGSSQRQVQRKRGAVYWMWLGLEDEKVDSWWWLMVDGCHWLRRLMLEGRLMVDVNMFFEFLSLLDPFGTGNLKECEKETSSFLKWWLKWTLSILSLEWTPVSSPRKAPRKTSILWYPTCRESQYHLHRRRRDLSGPQCGNVRTKCANPTDTFRWRDLFWMSSVDNLGTLVPWLLLSCFDFSFWIKEGWKRPGVQGEQFFFINGPYKESLTDDHPSKLEDVRLFVETHVVFLETLFDFCFFCVWSSFLP